MGGSRLFVGFFSVSTTSFALFRQNNFFKHLGCPPLDIHSRECLGKAKSGKVPGNPLLLHSWMSSQLYELLSICGICLNNVGMQNYLPSLSILFLREGTFSPIGSASPAVFCIVPKWPNLGNHTAEKFIDKKDKYYSEYNGPINGRLCWITGWSKETVTNESVIKSL